MYKLNSWDGVNGMLHFGTLVQCLRLARRNWRRLGIPSEIYRPDSTSLREISNRMAWRLP